MAKYFSILFFLSAFAFGHDGPPYPIWVDWKVGDGLVTVWGDPDVGTGSFIVTWENGAPPADVKITFETAPENNALPVQTNVATPSGDNRFLVEIPFPTQENWRVTVFIEAAGEKKSQSTIVAVTPPGLGKWDLLWYFLPFLGFGSVWVVSAFKTSSRVRPRTSTN